MLRRFKFLFAIYMIFGLLGYGVILLTYPMLDLPIVPGVYMYFGVMIGFFILRLFQVAREEDYTVRCGLLGHSMMNVRLESGGLDPVSGQYVKAIRVYACKRCGDNTVKIEP